MKKALWEEMKEAYEADDQSEMRHLIDGYSSGKMKAFYKMVYETQNYATYCAAKRGEQTRIGKKFGVC